MPLFAPLNHFLHNNFLHHSLHHYFLHNHYLHPHFLHYPRIFTYPHPCAHLWGPSFAGRLLQRAQAIATQLGALHALLADESSRAVAGRFEWVDGVLARAIVHGGWVLLDNANLCNPTVLDRLNPLLEPDGVCVFVCVYVCACVHVCACVRA